MAKIAEIKILFTLKSSWEHLTVNAKDNKKRKTDCRETSLSINAN